MCVVWKELSSSHLDSHADSHILGWSGCWFGVSVGVVSEHGNAVEGLGPGSGSDSEGVSHVVFGRSWHCNLCSFV